MTWTDAERFLLDLPRFAHAGAEAYKPGLERMERLLAALGDPHTRFRSVHVAGTNGKGSTASMVAAIATAAGLRTGLHTSPHLWDLAERMRLDGVSAPHDWIADAVSRYRSDLEGVQPSFFEATVALSFLYFAEMEVDLAVVEVGLGGRLDATNVLNPEIALVTHIGLDHADLLGPTLADVAREKAGIAKPDVPLLSAASERGGVLAALEHTAVARRATFVNTWEDVRVGVLGDGIDGIVLDLTTPLRTYERLRVGLPGRHQASNAALAVHAAERVVPMLQRDGRPVYAGLANVRKLSGLRARCEVVQRSPLVLADVAHNADGLRSAIDWARGLVSGRLYVVFGTMRDKDLGAMAETLKLADAVMPVGLPTPRAVTGSQLRSTLQRAGLRVIDVADVESAVLWFRDHGAPADGLLATGSHLTAAAAHHPTVS